MADLESLQGWANEFLTERPAPVIEGVLPIVPERPFSPFVSADLALAVEMAGALMRAADEVDGAGEFALSRVRELATMQARDNAGAARHALKLFITHDDRGRRLTIPALEQRAPQKVVPSGAQPVEDPEVALAWYREDPELNEHHDHWHVVYPFQGVPPDNHIKDRQGELFLYMHRQMLARYDTERLAIGLERVESLSDYKTPIAPGYDPKTSLKGFPPEWQDNLVPRPAGVQLRSLSYNEGVPLPDAERRLDEAIRSGDIDDPSELGAAIEASVGTPSTGFGSMHNNGHMLLATITGGPDNGVMADTDTAPRDPIFYRWHRRIDDVWLRWEGTQPPEPFDQWAAPVTIRKGDGPDFDSPDIIFCPAAKIPDGGDDAAARNYLRGRLGGDEWDANFYGETPVSTGELITRMLSRRLVFLEPNGTLPDVTVRYLDQDPFYYALRIENQTADPLWVAVRVFIAAEQCVEDRRMWIELDKFKHHLESSERSVAVRSGADSSVIRKPAVKPPGPIRHSRGTDTADDPDVYCTCGWPYNLLLPRGTSAGMDFRIIAVATDWHRDNVTESHCGSMSYCGAKDRYPDARLMGYPFARPFPSAGIVATLTQRAEMAMRRFTIRCAQS